MPVPDGFVGAIQSGNADVRFAAVASAWEQGPVALVALADAMASDDPEVAKSAKLAAEAIVHFAARPRHPDQTSAAANELLKIAADAARPALVRGQALEWLGFTAGDAQAGAIAKLLGDAPVRGDARMALERIPGDASLAALESAAASAPPDIRPHLEQSIANRKSTRDSIGTTRSFAVPQPATQPATHPATPAPTPTAPGAAAQNAPEPLASLNRHPAGPPLPPRPRLIERSPAATSRLETA